MKKSITVIKCGLFLSLIVFGIFCLLKILTWFSSNYHESYLEFVKIEVNMLCSLLVVLVFDVFLHYFYNLIWREVKTQKNQIKINNTLKKMIGCVILLIIALGILLIYVRGKGFTFNIFIKRFSRFFDIDSLISFLVISVVLKLRTICKFSDLKLNVSLFFLNGFTLYIDTMLVVTFYFTLLGDLIFRLFLSFIKREKTKTSQFFAKACNAIFYIILSIMNTNNKSSQVSKPVRIYS